MVRVSFTQNIQRHVACPTAAVRGETVADVLNSVFAENPHARGYVLDDEGRVRRHMVIFVDGQPIHDRDRLSDKVESGQEVFVMQALSGG